MTSASVVLQWHRQGRLVSKLIDIMQAGYAPSEIERFFAWLRASVPQQSSGIDWRSMRADIANATGKAFAANVVLFFLMMADPLVTEYQQRQTGPAFPRTKRPLTAHLDVVTDEEFLIRVVRYMDTPMSGIWHQQASADQQCGTFYYYEPDSVTMLSCPRNTVLFAANKMHAAYLLLQQAADDTLIDALRICYAKLIDFNEPNIAAVQSPAFRQFVLALLDALANGSAKANHPLLQLSPWGRPTTLLEDIDHTMRRAAPSAADTGTQMAESWGLSPRYVGYTIWSRLDRLDAPLCTHARQAGYQLIVLQSEAGRYQAVTEVLDTRPRAQSFEALVNLPLSVPPDAVFDASAPTIYYPRTANYFIDP